MITDADQYKCEKDGILMVWAFMRDTTIEEREDEGWPDEILDSPHSKEEWEKSDLWIGENNWELCPASDWDDADDLCATCQAKLKEEKPGVKE